MDSLTATGRRGVAAAASAGRGRPIRATRPQITAAAAIPAPPFWGDQVVRGIPLSDYAGFLDERATFLGQWGLRAAKRGPGPSYEELAETVGRPRLRGWLERLEADQLLDAAVVYGYYRAVSTDDDVILLGDDGRELTRFTLPRGRSDGSPCLADYLLARRPGAGVTAVADVVALQIVTVGSRVSEASAELFERGAYREYLELHGLSVQLSEALADFWLDRVRMELNIGTSGARFPVGGLGGVALQDRAKIAALLDPARIAVELSAESELHPEPSSDALVIHHPAAADFPVR